VLGVSILTNHDNIGVSILTNHDNMTIYVLGVSILTNHDNIGVSILTNHDNIGVSILTNHDNMTVYVLGVSIFVSVSTFFLLDFGTVLTKSPTPRGSAGGRIGTRFLRTSPLKGVNPAGTPGYRNGTERLFCLKGHPSVVRDV
jgi:hypothetical protein